ncbi:MAG: transketolase family protein [Candidatus Diapherotrites archaeon]|nr:transketolase family protein [Candidatus Diapherotrites archaeon]
MHLSEKIFSKPEMIPSRYGYGEGLVELGEKRNDVVVLGADLTASVCANWFQEKFPERFFQLGIAEQNMTNVAAGLSLVGKIPFVSTYGVFSTGRAWDQIRTTICYAKLNVKIGSAHGGISVGPDGATHQALEDIALMRVLPNMTVVVPSDSIESRKATVAVAEKIIGPAMVRFGREKVPVITTEKTPFELGKAQVLVEGKDVSIIACGAEVYYSLLAAKKLEEEGISVEVINLHTIKPIDKKTIIASAKKTGAVVTAEEHQVMAGMGSSVAEVLVQNYPVHMQFVGIQNRFGGSGNPDELMNEFNLTEKAIINAVKKVLDLKKN